MSIPSQSEMFLLVLQLYSDEKERSRKQAKHEIRESLNLTSEEITLLTSSGVPVYESRVSWAISQLDSGADFLERVSRGVYRINEKGIEFVSAHPEGSGLNALIQQGYQQKREAEPPTDTIQIVEKTMSFVAETSPEELITQGENGLYNQLAEELMESIMQIEGRDGDTFFEKLVTELIAKMGYGKSIGTPASGDGGIDGIVRTDRLGFDPIYIQAKRYSSGNKVGRPELQRFAGALGAITRGVFITTSTFQPGAEEFAKNYPHASIVLINGSQLIRLMIEYDIGVSTDRVIHIKKLDSDYFDLDS